MLRALVSRGPEEPPPPAGHQVETLGLVTWAHTGPPRPAPHTSTQTFIRRAATRLHSPGCRRPKRSEQTLPWSFDPRERKHREHEGETRGRARAGRENAAWRGGGPSPPHKEAQPAHSPCSELCCPLSCVNTPPQSPHAQRSPAPPHERCWTLDVHPLFSWGF